MQQQDEGPQREGRNVLKLSATPPPTPPPKTKLETVVECFRELPMIAIYIIMTGYILAMGYSFITTTVLKW